MQDRWRQIAAMVIGGILVAGAGCTASSSEGDDESDWIIPGEDGGADAGKDTGPDPPDTSPPPPDTSPPPPPPPPDGGECPSEIQPRDGTCNEACAHVDPDCADCPDPDDPDIDYVVYDDPRECRLADFGCPEGWERFDRELCGCGCRRLAGVCAAQRARAVGDCRTVVGVKFDGESCVSMSGCSCEGTDCEELYESVEACEEATRECGSDAGLCSAQDAVGEGSCAQLLGYKFDGDACRSVGGCECEGADCGEMYRSRERCERATGDCNRECGDPEAPVCDEYESIEPRECPEGTVYTVNECEPMCVDPETCRPPDDSAECGPDNGCGADQWCDYPNNSCGGDGPGECTPQPSGCPGVYSPVCGCDGSTYGNECMAQASGVDIAHEGECS